MSHVIFSAALPERIRPFQDFRTVRRNDAGAKLYFYSQNFISALLSSRSLTARFQMRAKTRTHALFVQVYNSVCRDWDCVVEPFAANLIVESSAGASLKRSFPSYNLLIVTELPPIADDFRCAAGSGPGGLHVNVAPRHIETLLAAASACTEVRLCAVPCCGLKAIFSLSSLCGALIQLCVAGAAAIDQPLIIQRPLGWNDRIAQTRGPFWVFPCRQWPSAVEHDWNSPHCRAR